MTCLKLFLFTAAVFIAVASVSGIKSNNYYECPDAGLAEEQLMNYTIHKPGQSYNVQSKDISFPASGIVNTRKITCIQIFDLTTYGTGGYATITSGGLDSTRISINLKSQTNKGLDFTIILWTPIIIAAPSESKINYA